MGEIATYIQNIYESMESETTLAVQLWMAWMSLIFLASIAFVWKYTPARVVLGAMLATIASVLYIWSLTKIIHLFGVAHILIWFPLAVYLWGAVLSQKGRERYQAHRPFYIWICLLVATIVVSLVFDIRDIYLVMHDAK